MVAGRMLQVVHHIAMLVVLHAVREQERQQRGEGAGTETRFIGQRDAADAVSDDEQRHGVERAEMRDSTVSATRVGQIVQRIVSATEFQHVRSAS